MGSYDKLREEMRKSHERVVEQIDAWGDSAISGPGIIAGSIGIVVVVILALVFLT